MDLVRKPAVSGMFYPDNPTKLKKDIETYLRHAIIPDFEEDIMSIVSPHAGYVYSGQVAAYGFKTVERKPYDTVILIGPSHRAYFDGVAVWPGGSFETPLGRVDIDEDIAGAMVNMGGIIRADMDVHRQEHSIEVQVPFLQSVLEDFKIIPLVMGIQTTDVCKKLAQSLYPVLRNSSKRFLTVCSTDLSHYYPDSKAKKLDSIIVDHLNTFNIPGMIESVETGKTEACGAGPIIVTMMLSEMLGANCGKVLKYADSGDISGDKSGVVGYVSAIFCGKQ